MREIKYQVWDKKSQTMCIVLQLEWIDGKLYAHYFHSPHLGKVRKTLDTTENPLLQFTGLHDKNGKEIYDSYVMLWPDEYKQVIWFNEKHIETSVRDIEKSQKLYDYMDVHFGYHFDSQHPVEQGEVIGNIYENPELVRS